MNSTMKENKNHLQDIDVAAEPIGLATPTFVNEKTYNIDDWPGMPLVGPSSLEEMNARIDEAEIEMETSEGYDWDSVMLDATNIVNEYANSVY
jgi:hypothetical protein